MTISVIKKIGEATSAEVFSIMIRGQLFVLKIVPVSKYWKDQLDALSVAQEITITKTLWDVVGGGGGGLSSLKGVSS
ncbi:hypothetical protein HDV00_010956 [Rhizophlyctis rosea]|nr:hypothetical protein HDV00_010956 [Rhizophlyctis rosea]